MKESLTNLSRIFKKSVQDFQGAVLYFCFSDEAQAKSLKGKPKPHLKLIESFVISK